MGQDGGDDMMPRLNAMRPARPDETGSATADVEGCDECRVIGPLLVAPGTSGRGWYCYGCGKVWSHNTQAADGGATDNETERRTMSTRFEMVAAKDATRAMFLPGDQVVAGVIDGHALAIGNESQTLVIVGSVHELRDLCDALRDTVINAVDVVNEVGDEPTRGCPNCGRADRLTSWEMVSIGYPVEFFGPDTFDYTDAVEERGDETGRYADDLSCRGCAWTGTAAKLIDVEVSQVTP